MLPNEKTMLALGASGGRVSQAGHNQYKAFIRWTVAWHQSWLLLSVLFPNTAQILIAHLCLVWLFGIHCILSVVLYYFYLYDWVHIWSQEASFSLHSLGHRTFHLNPSSATTYYGVAFSTLFTPSRLMFLDLNEYHRNSAFQRCEDLIRKCISSAWLGVELQ